LVLFGLIIGNSSSEKMTETGKPMDSKAVIERLPSLLMPGKADPEMLELFSSEIWAN